MKKKNSKKAKEKKNFTEQNAYFRSLNIFDYSKNVNVKAKGT